MAVRATLPEKPLRLVTVMLDEPDEPAGNVSRGILAEILKPVTVTTTLINRDKKPVTPVTVTL